MIKIESGIPVPVEARGGDRKSSDRENPLKGAEQMRVGDSFWVKASQKELKPQLERLLLQGWKFVMRAQTEDGRPGGNRMNSRSRGTRVWRVL